MRSFLLIFIAILTICSSWLTAQSFITGTIIDENEVPLPGVNIFIKGTTKGTVTDLDGEYAIPVNEEDTILVFSYVGYLTQEINVKGRTIVNVDLFPDVMKLDEVVVSALGITREVKSIGYARQTVSVDEMTQAREANIINSLSGKVAGVNVMPSMDAVGSSRIVIRGNRSLNGNNQPLFVIDGIPVENNQGDEKLVIGGAKKARDDIDLGNPISAISPDDIESIEVLKGPNASALYGSRGANGVVIITTKKGRKKDGLGITVSTNVMFNTIREVYDYQYAYGAGMDGTIGGNSEHRDDSTGLPLLSTYNLNWGPPMVGQPVVNYNGEITEYLPAPNTLRDFYRRGRTMTTSVTAETATETSTLRFSYTNLNAKDIIENINDHNRHNFYIRGTTKLGKRVSFDGKIMYIKDNVKNRMYRNANDRNPIYAFISFPKNMSYDDLIPWKKPDGTDFGINRDFYNPLWNLNEVKNIDDKNKIIGSLETKIKITDRLRFRVKAGADMEFRHVMEFNNMGASYDPDGYYKTESNKRIAWNYEALITYHRKFGSIKLNTLLGANYYNNDSHRHKNMLNKLIIPDFESAMNAGELPLTEESAWRKRINSVFSGVTLGFKEYLFVDITGRNDWSSTLPLENNSYFYPSVSGSFIISDAFELPEKVFSFAKIRASWAQVGNDASPFKVYPSFRYRGIVNGDPIIETREVQNNPDLKPEMTTSNEYGVDFKFLQNRIGFDVTYYESSTNNQIFEAQITPTSGYERKIFNAGEIQNKGIEVTLYMKPLRSSSLNWEIGTNWSQNRSKVVSLVDDITNFRLRGWAYVHVDAVVGESYGTLYGPVWLRDENGNRLVKENGREIKVIDQKMVNIEPDWIGAVTNSFNYKMFFLDILVDYQKGGHLFSITMSKARQNGGLEESVVGSEEYFMSRIVLDENENERKGLGIEGTEYSDSDRPKGIKYDAIVVVQDDNGEYEGEGLRWTSTGEKNKAWISPQSRDWGTNNNIGEMALYDASYVKLREVTMGCNLNKDKLKKLPIQNLRISAVGRNLWTIFKNTPRGLDPQSSTTSGNGQGIEFGGFLPSAYYGFDLKVSF